MIKGLLSEIHANGNRGAVIPFYRIDDIKKDMTVLKNGDYHPNWLNRMVNHITDVTNKFIPTDISFQPQSLITVAIPSPKCILKFQYDEEVVDVVVPPHYMNWDIKNKEALRCIGDYLAPHGFQAVMAVTLPHKLLAVHCGLGKYGRNNICYNEEFGSHMQIMTYISNLPCEEAPWFPISRMENCDKCNACVNACPTGAIDIGRRLINSDRCITVANEAPEAFPEWLEADMHNSITGCTKCQDCCPYNALNNNNVVMGAVFTEKETSELLNHTKHKSYTVELAAKLSGIGIAQGFLDQFPRNLSVLLMKK